MSDKYLFFAGIVYYDGVCGHIRIEAGKWRKLLLKYWCDI